MDNVKGLSRTEAEESARKYGYNALPERARVTFLKKYAESFNDPVIIILLVALGINVIFTFFGKVDWFECAGIFASVMIATLVGAFSEFKNEEEFRRIQAEASKTRCKVYREGVLSELGIGEIVVGDFVLLQAGDMIPADGFVCSGGVKVDQSLLTGEAREVLKKASICGGKGDNADFWDNTSLFRGTVICSGQCVMRVEYISDKTVYGKLSTEVREERISPLQLKLGVLAKRISCFGYIGAAAVVAVCMLQKIFAGGALNVGSYFSDYIQVLSDFVGAAITGITVIVVAVPEGLPLMIAIVCSLNMKKMMKSNVLVRKLIGIETAGSINILFSDKTGTITGGALKAVSFIDGAGNTTREFPELKKQQKEILGISLMYNSSAYASGNRVLGGNATEKALIEFVRAEKAEIPEVKRYREILFTSENKYSVTEINGSFCKALIKGAPEKILKRCTAYYDVNGKKQPLDSISKLTAQIDKLARRSIRVLAIATSDSFDPERLPSRLTLVGLVGLRDDLRPEVKGAVGDMKRAGIKTVMITGDKKETAEAIAREAGIITGADDLVLTSDELKTLSDEQLGKLLPRLGVVARALPTDKSRLVRLAQENGMVAGMTGDGVNDLSALQMADVGFAMGGGSDVAKEAGDIVILDNNFASIKKAVLYGRTIYKSIKKFVTFQMTINIAAVAVLVLGPIIGIEKPLGIVQMLWINLVMDTLAAIAFGGEAALGRYMLEKPIQREADIMDKNMWSAIAVNSLFICGMSCFMFVSKSVRGAFRADLNDTIFYTGYFSYFVFSCIFNAFNTRTDGIDLADHIALNKPFLVIIFAICAVQFFMTSFGGALLGTASLAANEWALVLVMAFLIIPIDILRKLILKRG